MYVTYKPLMLIYLTCIILFLILSSKYPTISGLFLARTPPATTVLAAAAAAVVVLVMSIPAFAEEEEEGSEGSDGGGSTDPPTVIIVKYSIVNIVWCIIIQ